MLNFFFSYIYFPIFLVLFLLKGLDYFTNWKYRGFKEFLIVTALDSFVVIFFIPLYLIRRKRFHKKLFQEISKEAKNLNKIQKHGFEFGIGHQENIKAPRCFLYSTSVSLNSDSSNLFDALNSLEKAVKNMDYKKVSNKYLEQVFLDLRFDGTWHFYNFLYMGFDFPHIDESLTITIMSNDHLSDEYNSSRIRINYIRFLLGTVIPLSKNFYFAVDRQSGVQHMKKLHAGFKTKHGLGTSDSIHLWLAGLSDSNEDRIIKSEWDSISKKVQSKLKTDSRKFANFSEASVHINNSIARLKDLNDSKANVRS